MQIQVAILVDHFGTKAPLRLDHHPDKIWNLMTLQAVTKKDAQILSRLGRGMMALCATAGTMVRKGGVVELQRPTTAYDKQGRSDEREGVDAYYGRLFQHQRNT